MGDIKVIVEVEIPENFTPCENDRDVYEKHSCPFAYYHYDDGCNACGYDFRDCPMKTMKLVE